MQIGETMKIKLNAITADMDLAFSEMTYQYAQACSYISEYIFSHDMNINSNLLSRKLYRTLRSEFGLKSQLAQSAIKTVTARYQTVDTQLKKSPYRFFLFSMWRISSFALSSRSAPSALRQISAFSGLERLIPLHTYIVSIGISEKSYQQKGPRRLFIL